MSAKNKKYTRLICFGIIISIIGFFMVGMSTGWITSMGIFLILWGHNVEKHL